MYTVYFNASLHNQNVKSTVRSVKHSPQEHDIQSNDIPNSFFKF